ncbi:hypothetical protein LPB144_07265 [Christiangramia salexigens]|uniref:Ig-like domain-containing protein n=2 Tax=Christiangramia salexigens TaxID=1913577 RepID=A0A1L3J4Y3_9FLAO|nr:hypothetical protein LPB144_07265 [Christiangramia salexigens]
MFSGFAGAQCPSSVSITSDLGNNICEGEPVTFSSSYTGTTGALTYEWQVNGNIVASTTNYTSSAVNNTDVVQLIIRSVNLNASLCETPSNSITMTVNQNRTGSVTIQASNTNICPSENVDFSISSSANLGANPSFTWQRIRGGNTTTIGTTNSISNNNLQNGDQVFLSVVSTIPCTTPDPVISTNTITISEKPGIPAQPGAISGDNNICPGVVKSYSVPLVSGITYNWILPTGWTGSSTSNTISVTPGTAGGDIKVTAQNSCGISIERTRTITVLSGTPVTPGAFTSGPAELCPNTAATYTVPAVTGANEYIWTLPAGFSPSGTTSTPTPTINVTSGASGSGNLSVIAKNICGQSSARTMAVTVKSGTPGTPGTITGDATICPGISKTYTIPAISGASQYIWTLPTGFTAPNLTTPGPSITVTAGATGSGSITVRASNDCGTSPTPSSKTISINTAAPVITGDINGPVNVCANAQTQEGSPYTYSITVSNSPTIAWTLPSGWSILSGAGTSSITVKTGTTGGTVSVTASNSCGTVSRNLSVGLNNPAPVMTGNITGPAKVCASATGFIYSIPAITNASEYIWTLPSGWNITAGETTRNITVSTPSSPSPNNTISVVAKNTCGTSASISYSVSANSTVPAQPGTISTDLPSSAICPPVTGYKFWVTPVSGVTYNWIVPSGFTITNGAGTNEITVNIASNTSYGNNIKVEVEAVNACGPSTRRTYNNINIDNFAFADLGPDLTVCSSSNPISLSGIIGFGNGNSKLKISVLTTSSPPQTNAYIGPEFSNVPNGKVNDFNFTFTPTTQQRTNGQVTITLITESPTGNNNCTAQGRDEMTIFFRPVPTASISSTSPVCSGDSATLTFTGTPNTSVVYRVAGVDQPAINIGASGTATHTVNNLTATTTYNLRSIQYSTSPNCLVNPLSGSTTVTVTQRPTASISYNSPICRTNPNPQPVTFSGTNAYTGGSFTSAAGLTINGSTGAITPGSSTPGDYTVTYTIPASANCPAIPVTTQVSILAPPVITNHPVNARHCEGDSTTFQVQVTGSSLTYQWYRNSVAAGNEIAGATSSSLTLNNLTASQAGDYYVVVGNSAGCAPITSQPAQLIVDQNIIIDTQPLTKSACSGDNTSFNVTASVGGIPLDNSFSYQWYKGTPGSGSIISGANAASLPLNDVSVSSSGDYYVEITGPAGYTCQKVTSQAANLTVRPIPVVEISGNNQICDGEASDISFFNGTPDAVVTYILNNDNTNPQNISLDNNGEAIINTGALFVTNNTETNFKYELTSVAYPDDPNCSNTVSGTVTITVTPNPNASFSFPDDQIEFCTADDSIYTPSLSGSGNFTGGTYSASGLNIDPINGSFIPENNSAGDYTITYTIPAYGGCEPEDISLDISLYEEVIITSQPYNLGICSTSDADFSVVASGDNLTYQWFKVVGQPDINSSEADDIAMTGANSNILSLPIATLNDAGEYYVRIAGTDACTPSQSTQVNSDVVTLNVDEQIVILEPATDIQVCETGDSSVVFKFIAHATGAPLNFTWIYDNGDPVPIGGDFMENVIARNDYPGHNYTVYEGTLTISNIEQADDASYAVRIDGSANNFNCPVAISNSFNLDVDPLPDVPVVENISYCLGEEAIPLTASGDTNATFTWYDANGQNPTTTAPTPLTTTAGSTSYFVTQMDSFCESEMAEIVVTVNPLPSAPMLTAEELNPNYCVGETSVPLTATPDAGASLNWYGPNDPDLSLSAAPEPQTSTQGEIYYWVSQTDTNICEGEKVMITVNINNLPDVSITNSGEDTICEGDTIELTATDANDTNSSTTYSWDWTNNSGNPFTGNLQTFNPTSTTTYTVTATTANGCINTEEITINVDPLPVAGMLTGPANVCITNPSGSLDLSGYAGNIIQWEFKNEADIDWTVITEANPDSNYMFSNIADNTSYRVKIGSGICSEVYSNEITIQVDPIPVGGELNFGTTGRIFLICEGANSGYAVPLNLTGYAGQIEKWEYKGEYDSSWTTITEGGTNFIGTTLSALQIEAAVNNQTTAFRVEISSGACSPNEFSRTGLISVIPTDIEPAPVSVDPKYLCFGDEITLSSSTGYGAEYGQFQGGAFDNAGIKNHGWRFTNPNGGSNDFSSAADNGRADHWLRMNPHGQNPNPNEKVYTANLFPIDQQSASNGYMVNFDTYIDPAGNKGFAIVTGDNDSFMETPIFSLGGLDEAILTFDQAYNLTEGANIRVELSTDGGNSYNIILMDITGTASSDHYDNFGELTPEQRPLNKMEYDLGSYIGQPNLRVRFNYVGTLDGDVWAVDNIKVPEGPQDVQLIWYYDEDLNDPNNDLEQIGAVNQGTVQFTPRKIGWNDFEVQTALLFDTNGDPCEAAINSRVISVYVFDTYESVATSSVGACGNIDVSLGAAITGAVQGPITEFPEGDGSTVAWEVISAPGSYVFNPAHFVNDDSDLSAINDPNARFQPPVEGDYTLRWVITPNTSPVQGEEDIPANFCPITYIDTNFTFVFCSTLDFDGIDDHIVISDGYASAQTIEAWIRPEALNGAGPTEDAVILSNESYELYITNGQKLTFRWGNQKVSSNKAFVPDTRWYHVAVVFNGSNAAIYIDGIDIKDKTTGSQTATGSGNETIIGARYNGPGVAPDNYFSGWIEEVRIWDTQINLEQIRFLMNQHIDYNQSPNLRGEIIPLAVPGGLNYANLLGYYRLIAQIDALDNPDPVFAITNGLTPDMATNKANGRLYNITTLQENTAPMPYYSRADSQESAGRNWMTDDTWRHWQVWDPPNSRGIDKDNTLINWNIAVISHNIDSGNIESGRDTNPFGDEYALTLLGLISETGLLRMANPSQDLNENNDGQHLRVTHYLRLDGNIDLVGESQLIQDQGSVLYNASAGWLERDQQGTRSSYNYNYWSSPVSPQGAAINVNADYSINQVLWDGTNASTPKAPNYQGTYHAADHDDRKDPVILSTYWMWRFRGTADVYGQWRHVAQTGLMKTGEGYTMKGTSGTAGVKDWQNYVFKGKPHNGDFTRFIDNNMNYLLGNPYPSAMDADEFILDNHKDIPGGRNSNNVFNGVLYFWDHFAGQTHILADYIGGYAAYSLAGGVPGVALDPRVNNNNESGTKIPSRFIPVAQGFFLLTNRDDEVNQSATPQFGDVVFKNRQRVGIRENIIYAGEDPSIFLKPIYPTKKEMVKGRDPRTKIRLKFISPKGYNRQILVTRDEKTTSGYDIGYDAPLADNQKEDMYWIINNKEYVIQGVPDFYESRQLPLGIRINQTGEFKIKIDSTENWPEGNPIYLKDKLLDLVHDIRKEAYIGNSEPGEFRDRFEIVFKKDSEDEPDPADPDPTEPDPTNPDASDPDPIDPVIDEPEPDLPVIEGLVGIGYSHFTKTLKIFNYDELEIEKVMIFDMRGKLIQQFNNLPRDKEISLYMRPVRSGVYIVKVFCKKGVCNKKIVIK